MCLACVRLGLWGSTVGWAGRPFQAELECSLNPGSDTPGSKGIPSLVLCGLPIRQPVRARPSASVNPNTGDGLLATAEAVRRGTGGPGGCRGRGGLHGWGCDRKCPPVSACAPLGTQDQRAQLPSC